MRLFIFVAAAVAAAGLACADAGAWRNSGPGGGGWVQSILASRHCASRMFVGCDVAGFFRSDDGGRRYLTHNGGLRHLWVSTIAEHPTDENILLLGSEGGIYKSVDGGRTWREKRTGLPPVRPYSHSVQICKFAFSRANPDVVFATEGNPRRNQGGSGVLWKSTDCGETWRVAAVEGSFPEKTYCWDVAMDCSNDKNIVISTNRGLFRSEDGGVHWASSNAGLPESANTRMLARGVSNPEVVYVTIKPSGGGKPWAYGAYRSDDGGRTWSERNGGLEKREGAPGEGAVKVSWYDCVAVDPRNPDVAYLAGGSWICDAIWKTEDGGRIWKKVFATPPHQGWIDFWGTCVTTMSLSERFPEYIVFGTAGVVYRSEDGGRSWKQRYTEERNDGKIASTGLELTCLFAVVPDRTKRGKYFFEYADVGLMVTEDDGHTFRRAMEGTWGDAFTVIPSSDDPSIVFGAFGAKGAAPWHRMFESRDGGYSWSALGADKEPWADCWAADLQCMSASAPYTLAYIARGRGIAISEDSGASWRLVSTNAFPVARRVTALLARGRTLLAGTGATDTEDGQIWASTDLGEKWRRLTDDGLKMGAVQSLAASSGKIVAGTREQWSGKGRGMRGGGAWVSLDAGKTWRRSLTNRFCHAVAFAGDRILAGTDEPQFHDHYVADGLFFSDDDGASWTQDDGDGLANRNITSIAVDPFDSEIVWVGTGGNSAFVRRIVRRKGSKR